MNSSVPPLPASHLCVTKTEQVRRLWNRICMAPLTTYCNSREDCCCRKPALLTTGGFTGWESRRTLTCSDKTLVQTSLFWHLLWEFLSLHLQVKGSSLTIASSSYNKGNAKLQKHRGRKLILGPAWSTCWHLITQTPLSAIIRNKNYLSGSHLSPTASFMDFLISILAICACFSPSALAPKATSWIPYEPWLFWIFVHGAVIVGEGFFFWVLVEGVLPGLS